MIMCQFSICNVLYFITLKNMTSPGLCGSGDWVPACEPNGRQFNYQSGHMLGWQARSPVGACERQPISVPLTLRCLFSLQIKPKNINLKKSQIWPYCSGKGCHPFLTSSLGLSRDCSWKIPSSSSEAICFLFSSFLLSPVIHCFLHILRIWKPPNQGHELWTDILYKNCS